MAYLVVGPAKTMLAGLYRVMQQGCGGSRFGHYEASAHVRIPRGRRRRHDRRGPGPEDSDDAAAPCQFLRKCAWVTSTTVFAALLILPFVWVVVPVLRNTVLKWRLDADLARPSRKAPQGSSFFREKMLVGHGPTVRATTASLHHALRPTLAPRAAGAGQPAAAAAAAAPAVRPAGAEDADSGNACAANEELFAGLCYKTCSLLTSGSDPIRTSPWTCCQSHPCALNQKGSLGSHVACSGYDVAGDGSCPHRPGTCLEDEEMLLGICYRKCSLLTHQEYSFRMGPATCCKDGGLSCLDFRKDYTSKEFAVGGGGKAKEEACGDDGELLLGVCYKKCSTLTGNEYPLRVAAATCCKADSRLPHKGADGAWHLGCLDFRRDRTRPEFGALAQGGDESKAHPPLESSAEAATLPS